MSRNKKFISLLDYSSDLAMEWHPTKNGNITAADVSAGSGKKVWWLCEKGHEWEAVINSRNAGVGCPVCSGRKTLAGYNDLATIRPDIAKQWHPTLNGELKPTEVTIHSEAKVCWVCDKGHEWITTVSHRVEGSNCPVCIGKKVLAGFNDLATIRPDIAKQWHPAKNGTLTPQDVTVSSNKITWWMCAKGHEWESSISNRTRGNNCPICFGETKTSFPEQAIFYYLCKITTAQNRYMLDSRTEIDIYLPKYKIGIEYDGAYFHSGEKARQREQKKQEKLNSFGITLIRVRELIDEENDNIICVKKGANDSELTQTIIRLCDRIAYLTGLSININIDVQNDRSKIYEQYIQSEKENSLMVLNPKLAKEWHPTKNGKLQPEYVSASSNKRAWWMCDKGHEWIAAINSRSSGVGCPYCAGVRVTKGVNDLATVNPELAKQWHPNRNGNLTPSDVLPHSNIDYWWICDKGHEWKTSASHRTRGRGCPVCSGHKVLVGYNDLSTTHPDLAKEWHSTKNEKLKPTDLTHGSDKKIWWLGECGHEWEAAVSSRSIGRGCPYCAGQIVIAGLNDLATLNPKLAKQWHPTKNIPLTPLDVMPNSNKKAWWLGDCGHEWEAVIGSRNTGIGCPYCANKKLLVGFNDLETINPILASQWHPTKNGGLTPKDILSGSNKQVWWQCEKGHEWKNSVSSRNSGHECPYCQNQMVWVGYNDLATLNPELAKQWHPTKNGDKKPSDFTPGANKKAWWICDKGHEWEARISSRNKGHGCSVCYHINRTNKK